MNATSGLRWIGTSRIIAQALTWAMTIFTVRLLEPGDYGLVATAGLFTIFASLLLDGGLGLVLVSEERLSLRDYGAAATWVFCFSLVLAAIVYVVAPLGGLFFNTPALTAVLRVSALQLPLWALLVVPAALQAKEMRFRDMALVQLVGSVVQGVATLVLAYRGAAYWSLTYGTLIGTATRAILQWSFVQARPWPNFHFQALRPLLPKCVHMTGQRIVYFCTSDFDTFMLGRVGGPAMLGAYALAKNLAHSVLDQLSGIVNQVSVPIFAAMRGDTPAQVGGIQQLISTTSVFVFPLFWVMGVISQLALPLLLGPHWSSLVIPFMAFTFVLPFRAVYTLLDSAVVGTGRVNTTFRNMLVWAVIMIPILFFGAQHGANAVALAWILGFPVVFGFSMRNIAKAFGVNISALLRPMAAPLIWAALTCLVVELAGVALRDQITPVAELSVEVLVAGICYWLFMRRFARSQYERVLRHALRVVGR